MVGGCGRSSCSDSKICSDGLRLEIPAMEAASTVGPTSAHSSPVNGVLRSSTQFSIPFEPLIFHADSAHCVLAIVRRRCRHNIAINSIIAITGSLTVFSLGLNSTYSICAIRLLAIGFAVIDAPILSIATLNGFITDVVHFSLAKARPL